MRVQDQSGRRGDRLSTRSSRRRRSTSWSRSTAGSPARRVGAAGHPAGAGGRGSPPGASCPTSCRRPRPIRDDPTWRVAPPAPGLVDRRVEITGPPDRKMTVNALNSGAKVWLADFEDATSPTWDNVIGGQLNLLDAIDRPARLHQPGRASGTRSATTRRPSWSARAAGTWSRSTSSSTAGRSPPRLVDFGLYLFHCARGRSTPAAARTSTCPSWRATSRRGCGTTSSSSPRTTSASRRAPSAPPCSSRRSPPRSRWTRSSTSCASTAPGLNAGRWDYIFSIIKNFGQRDPTSSCPDRAEVTMTVPFMRAYTELLVRTCHRRGAHAIGGMAAFIPSRDPAANEAAFAKVRADKEREAADGFDGSWVAHPGAGRRLPRRRSTRCSATGRTSSTGCATTSRSPPPTCSPSTGRRRRGHARRACAPTSPSRCATSTPGCAAPARWRSST